MPEKFEMAMWVTERGFYVQSRVHHPRAGYIQSTNYGPLDADEVLQLFSDCPVPVVVDMAQRRLF